MPVIYRVLFPACACFGPMFIVVGLQGQRTSSGVFFAGVGALMTSAALLMLFGRVSETPTVTPARRRDQLLFWGAVIVIGVLMWLLTAGR